MKQIIKKAVALMLTLAVALTGISFGDTTAAQAKVVFSNAMAIKEALGIQSFSELDGTTVTMKIGDEKMIDFRKDYDGTLLDITDSYEWKSSDESVVSMIKTYEYETENDVTFFTIKAEKAGTAVITGYNDYTDDTVSCTVVVPKQKMTAKQKKCKHSWKTTKKASCISTGMKTCKKCKLQKTIAKKAHVWKTSTFTKTEYTEYMIFECNACCCEDPELQKLHDKTFDCENWCGMQFKETDYGSKQAALEALRAHYAVHKYSTSVVNKYEYGNPHKVTVTETRCKNCNQTPETLEKYK